MKFLKLGLALLLLVNLTGCWSKVELDKLTFIFGMYIDAGNEPGTVEVSINSPLPNRLLSSSQSGGSQGKSYSLVTKTAPTITDAVILIQKDLSRRLEISHIKAVVVGKDYAEGGIREILEWFKRQPEFPIGTYIMGAPGKAKDIAQLSPIFEQLPDQVLQEFSQENLTFATTVKDCLLAEANGMGFAMNYLSFGENPQETEQGKPVKWAGVQGVMLFRKAALQHTLDVQDSRALSWAAGDLAGHLTLPIYTVRWKNEDKGTASALFYSDGSVKKVKMTKDGPVFHIKLKGKASVTFFKDADGRSASELSSLIEQLLRKKIESEVMHAIKATQKAGVDVLQLGMLMEWNYPKAWKKLQEQWDDYYSNDARITLSTDIKIEDFGSVK